MRAATQYSIEDFCETGSGGTPNRANNQYFGGNIPWVKSGELRELIIYDTEEKITELGLSKSAAKLVPRGSILVAMYGATVGRMAFLGIDAATNQAVCNIRPDPERADSRYVFHALQAKIGYFLARAAGGAQPNISQGIIREAQIPLPPLDEQRRIASILDMADALRRSSKRSLDLLSGLEEAIFHGCFGDLVSSTKYGRGPISKWIANFDTGKNLAPDPDGKSTNGYRVLKVSAVTTGTFIAAESKPLPRDYEPPQAHLVRKGDLLFSRANTAELIGATAIVTEAYRNLVLPDKIWRFVWNSKNPPNPQFIKSLFGTRAFRYEISKRATGTSGSMKNISKSKVLEIDVAMPTRAQQDDYVNRLAAVQRTTAAARRQETLMISQFAALQHRAFSGQL